MGLLVVRAAEGMEEEVGLRQLLGRREVHQRAVGEGLVAPHAASRLGRHLVTEHIVDGVEEEAGALEDIAGCGAAAEEVGEALAGVVDGVDLGTREGRAAGHDLRVGLVRVGRIRLRLIGHAHRVLIDQPGGVAVGVAGDWQAGFWIVFTDRRQRLEVGVGEIGIAALAIDRVFRRLVGGAGLGDERGDFTDDFGARQVGGKVGVGRIDGRLVGRQQPRGGKLHVEHEQLPAIIAAERSHRTLRLAAMLDHADEFLTAGRERRDHLLLAGAGKFGSTVEATVAFFRHQAGDVPTAGELGGIRTPEGAAVGRHAIERARVLVAAGHGEEITIVALGEFERLWIDDQRVFPLAIVVAGVLIDDQHVGVGSLDPLQAVGGNHL